MYLKITKEMEDKIKAWWGVKIEEITDDIAVEIVKEFLDITPKYAWVDDDEIYYPEEEEDEYDDDDMAPEWSEEYLNTLGMSLTDFF